MVKPLIYKEEKNDEKRHSRNDHAVYACPSYIIHGVVKKKQQKVAVKQVRHRQRTHNKMSPESDGNTYHIRVACNDEAPRAENIILAAERLNEQLKAEGSSDVVTAEYI